MRWKLSSLVKCKCNKNVNGEFPALVFYVKKYRETSKVQLWQNKEEDDTEKDGSKSDMKSAWSLQSYRIWYTEEQEETRMSGDILHWLHSQDSVTDTLL
jgi:hypothetical protein